MLLGSWNKLNFGAMPQQLTVDKKDKKNFNQNKLRRGHT